MSRAVRTFRTTPSWRRLRHASATLSIDASGRLTRVAASNGAVASFSANLRGQMVQTVTPGGTVTYVYDARNLPVEIRFSDGRWVRYTYSAAHKLVEIADSTGQVERIARLQPEAFQRERMGQTLALWLRSRGELWSDLFVPKAHAQAQVLIPAGVALFFFVLADTTRRNTPEPGGAGRCCGQDGPAGSNTALPERPKWISQIAISLSAQSSATPVAESSVFDKALLLVSPKSCMKNPGNCKHDDYDRLREEQAWVGVSRCEDFLSRMGR